MLNDVRKAVRSDLEAPADMRRVGTGWVSGVAGLVASVAALFMVLCLKYPGLLTVQPMRGFYAQPVFRTGLHLLLVGAFVMSILSLVLRANKVLGFTGVAVTLLATVLGGSRVASQHGELTGGAYLGLDWFVLNVVFTGFLFIPLERLFGKYADQPLFRLQWREDLFYFLVSSLFVQAFTFASLAPGTVLVEHTSWENLRTWVGSQWVWAQVVEVMVLTDLVQYFVHRLFHRVPFLWGFHAVHHSAQRMDWMAGARMHFMEIIILRGTTVIPMLVLGYSQVAIQVYIFLVYVLSTFIHANVGWDLDWLGKFFVTPRFHHWHHGVEEEAIDVNFAIHFPQLDRLFGTFYLPKGRWPTGYGVGGHPVPVGYWKQLWYPFARVLGKQG